MRTVKPGSDAGLYYFEAFSVKKALITVIKDISKNYLESILIISRYALTFYDHWLSEDEADAAFAMLNYQDYIRLQDIEIKIVDFFINLHNVYPIIYFDEGFDTLNDFVSEGELIEFIINGLREIEKFIFYVESMGVIFISGF